MNWDRNSDEIVIKSLTSLGVKSTRTSYGILEKIVHGILDGVHVCFTDPTDRRACMFHITSWEYHYDRCRYFDDLDR